MAVAWVSKISARDASASSSTLTLASVVGSGGDLVLALFTWRNNGETMSGATYGGVSMTRVSGLPFTGGEVGVDCFYRLAPSGTADVVGTWSAATRLYGTASVFSGVHQSSPFGTVGTETGTGTATTDITVSTTVNGMVADVIMIRIDDTLNEDAGQTKRSEELTTGTENHATSTEPATGTSHTLGWTWTNSEQYRFVAIPINPAGDAVRRFLLVR